MRVKNTNGYLLVLYSYMEEETYYYETVEELLEDWNYDSLSQFFEHYDNATIYKIRGVISGSE